MLLGEPQVQSSRQSQGPKNGQNILFFFFFNKVKQYNKNSQAASLSTPGFPPSLVLSTGSLSFTPHTDTGHPTEKTKLL